MIDPAPRWLTAISVACMWSAFGFVVGTLVPPHGIIWLRWIIIPVSLFIGIVHLVALTMVNKEPA